MPRTKSPPPAPTPLTNEDRQDFLRVLHHSNEPLEAAKLAKLVNTTRRPTSDEVAAILEQFVADGAAVPWPAKSAKGKPRFWDRDVKSIGRTAFLKTIEQATEPLAVKDMIKLAKLPVRLSEADTSSILQDLVVSQSIHEIPAKTASGGPRYWSKDVNEYAHESLLAELASQPPLTKPKVKALLKWLDQARFDQLVERMVSRQEIFCHPPVGKSGQPLWSTAPPSADAYFRGIGEQLASLVATLQAASVSAVDLRRAAVQMLESAGITLAVTTAGAMSGTTATGHLRQRVDLLQLMQMIEPGALRGALVTAPMLRQAAQLSKPEFDALVLELARDGRLVLHEHDFASSLSPEDRDELVTDGRGHFFVGMAIRQK